MEGRVGTPALAVEVRCRRNADLAAEVPKRAGAQDRGGTRLANDVLRETRDAKGAGRRLHRGSEYIAESRRDSDSGCHTSSRVYASGYGVAARRPEDCKGWWR